MILLQLPLAARAFKNMLRMAAHDPVWAISSAVLTPFRAGKSVFKAVVALTIVVFSLGLLSDYMLTVTGLADNWLAKFLVGNTVFLFLVALMFRMLTTPLILHFGDMDSDAHGTARFALKREIAPLARSETGLLIGRDRQSKRLLRYNGPAHLLTMAPTRTGKGVGTIIPNLLDADRSVICIDPKGENAKITARARQSFGPVHVLDPFAVTGMITAAFNPLDQLNLDSLDLAEDVSTLADALVADDPGAVGEAHWNEEAKALIAGLLLTIVVDEPPQRRTLSTLREYLTLAPERFDKLLSHMQQSEHANGLIARAANRHLGKADREAAGVLSAAQRHTHFLDSQRMTEVLSRSDFSFCDLKRSHATVFLVLPPDRLSTYSRWLRLLVTQSLIDMARTAEKPDQPVLYLLDEFAALGFLAPVERAMGLMAGYGVQLWPILQDIHQLQASYGKRAGTFLSNAGVLQVFGVNENESAKLVSDLLGQETVTFQNMGRAVDADRSSISFSQQHTGRPLLTPDEVRNLSQEYQLLFLAGTRPILARKLAYFRDKEFRSLYHPPT
ncbi:type IV secretion system protein VirD4 [Pseudorhizobium tarimense]|uniref:Type IV secretion system protein VirD4 n=1 Tax=Pseudorhizobium tarimense TaxID=1079109 RepID=A0ABV2H5S0_9HYPH|nr:type IV secretory system conjugative DNA transfer family protein [Pseudorhizobium tarimense]MCJ8519268.1 type IV secretory system conjugative DNA transfer family protein [Pseudorhizobium tarimense]